MSHCFIYIALPGDLPEQDIPDAVTAVMARFAWRWDWWEPTNLHPELDRHYARLEAIPHEVLEREPDVVITLDGDEVPRHPTTANPFTHMPPDTWIAAVDEAR